MPPADAPPDPVTRALDRVRALVRGRPQEEDVDALLTDLDALDDRAFIRFDARSRTWSSGLDPGEIARLRSRWRRSAAHALWAVMGLVSADGHDRQRAITETQLHRSTTALLALRSTDWVPEVRQAAMSRLADAQSDLLLDLLPLLEVLTHERLRAEQLDELIESRLADDDLRAATHSESALTRRAAWRRLVAREAYDVRDLRERAVRDPDILVRATAAGLLPDLDDESRRTIASTLVGDRVGWLAGRGLEVMIELDGEPAIRAALTSPNATLRRRAREWAAIRGVDARSVYLDLLHRDPADALALIALAEIGDSADEWLLPEALDDDRARVRAAALKAVARLNAAAAREAAVEELVTGRSGRGMRAAAFVLRAASLSEHDLQRLEDVGLDAQRPAGQRLRALALLRPSRWRHLAAVLQARRTAPPPLRDVLDEELRMWTAKSSHIARGPDECRRETIVALLPDLDPAARRTIDFVLRTTV